MCDCTSARMYYTSSRNIAYVRITIHVLRPTQDRMDFSCFSKACFSKSLVLIYAIEDDQPLF